MQGIWMAFSFRQDCTFSRPRSQNTWVVATSDICFELNSKTWFLKQLSYGYSNSFLDFKCYNPVNFKNLVDIYVTFLSGKNLLHEVQSLFMLDLHSVISLRSTIYIFLTHHCICCEGFCTIWNGCKNNHQLPFSLLGYVPIGQHTYLQLIIVCVLQDVVLIGMAVGITANSLFHFGLRKMNSHKIQSLIIEQEPSTMSRICNYLQTPVLFQVAVLYVTSRLFLTISLVYMPLYLNESGDEGKELLASVPFVCYLSSFIASIGIRYINTLYGSKVRKYWVLVQGNIFS